MRTRVGVLLALSVIGCSNGTPCPVGVPLHCGCASANPVCVNGQWTCPDTSACPDAGGGAGCTDDSQCGANAYCRGLLSVCKGDCQLTIGTAIACACHRSCLNQACACADDTDCPGFYTSCDLASHACKTLAPPICHSNCPTACTHATDTQYGEVCLCGACP
jgi:hypothetical protein